MSFAFRPSSLNAVSLAGFTVDIAAGATDDHLPTAHTCFNTLHLPVYRSKEKLREKLMAATPYGEAGIFLK